MLDLNIVKTFTHVIQIIVLSLCCWGIVVMCLWVDLYVGGCMGHAYPDQRGGILSQTGAYTVLLSHDVVGRPGLSLSRQTDCALSTLRAAQMHS